MIINMYVSLATAAACCSASTVIVLGNGESVQFYTITGMKNVILLLCGSFNPITTSHVHMFKIAKRFLEEHCVPQRVIASIISPVNDKYSGKKLVDSHHRIEMIKIALSASNCTWITVDDFECKQDEWMRTVQVLRHIENKVKHGAFLESLNLSPVEISVKLLCGADLIESFVIPNLWEDRDIEEIVGKYGIVVVPRKGWDPEKFISEHKILSRFAENVFVTKCWKGDDVSATRVRNAIAKGEDVTGLVEPPVLEYIKEHNLYSSK